MTNGCRMMLEGFFFFLPYNSGRLCKALSSRWCFIIKRENERSNLKIKSIRWPQFSFLQNNFNHSKVGRNRYSDRKIICPQYGWKNWFFRIFTDYHRRSYVNREIDVNIQNMRYRKPDERSTGEETSLLGAKLTVWMSALLLSTM